MFRRALGLGMVGLAWPALAAEMEVGIDNFTFSPAVLTVVPGTRVVWVNRDDNPHTIVDQDEPRRMRSGALDTGERFGFVFAAAGTFRYFCTLHPHMQGTIVVRT